MIRIKQVTKIFGTQRVLDQVSLDVNSGETVALLGPSGSGKTTLLRCINGLERFTEGEIEMDGVSLFPPGTLVDHDRSLAQIRLMCGFVFQQFHLFPHMSALANVALAPINVQKIPRPQAESHALELLRTMGLEHRADQRPSRLSGGEQQRVAIARALALRPRVLLYDEPTSALDPQRAREMWQIMSRLASEGQTQVIVTHQVELTNHIPCRVVRMSAGKVIENQ
jgi:general L-amino acid transport system ATP-binding protein